MVEEAAAAEQHRTHQTHQTQLQVEVFLNKIVIKWSEQ